MALLDMQGLASRGCDDGHRGGSDVSVLLCDSLVSTTLCL